ncbi:MAG: aminopeptidase P family protein [Dehalococcoidales bacterium]|nr:aminopeptidase P family protein [Dehalococcoidales bacterium]
MSISRREFERRYAAIRQQMERDSLECLLVVGLSDDFNRGNIRYVTGSGRGGCCVFPLEGDPVFMTGLNQSASPKIPKTVEAFELLDLRETDNPAGQVVEELSRFYTGNRIGIVGMNCIPVPLYLAVKEKFPDKLVDSVKIFEDLRSVKSAEEIEKMRVAAAVADDVYAMLVNLVKPGLSDYEIYGHVKKAIYEKGCEYSFDLIDASGSRMNMTFWPTGERLKENNTLFMEITPAYDGYYAQLPVTLPVGKYPPEIRKMVSVWEQANEAALEILKPGTKVSDVYLTLVNTVRENGYISPLRPGHAIGLDALDFWSITESSTITLKQGMTLAVHPSIMTEIGGDACGMGYTYLITDTGAERFSKVELAELMK